MLDMLQGEGHPSLGNKHRLHIQQGTEKLNQGLMVKKKPDNTNPSNSNKVLENKMGKLMVNN